MPDLFIRGAGTYTAHINAGNPVATMQSIEHTLRALDRATADEQQQLQRLEKTLIDYQAQAQQRRLRRRLDLSPGVPRQQEPEPDQSNGHNRERFNSLREQHRGGDADPILQPSRLLEAAVAMQRPLAAQVFKAFEHQT